MTIEDEITKNWLKDHPYDPAVELPKGWEFRFGMRGRFLKYDSIAHAERKNMILVRETNTEVPFGYCNKEWEELKNNLQPTDEIWRHGGGGGESVYLIRDGKVVQDVCGKWEYPKRGYHITLTCY